MLAGMMARPRATSSRTNSGFMPSRRAMNSISRVISPRRAYCNWVTGPPVERRGRLWRAAGISAPLALSGASDACGSDWPTPPRSAIHFARSLGMPWRTSVSCGPEVS